MDHTTTLAQLVRSAASGHTCSTDCVKLANESCGCSSAPSMCEVCEEFYADHPTINV